MLSCFAIANIWCVLSHCNLFRPLCSGPTAEPTEQPTNSPTFCQDVDGQNSSNGVVESTFDVGLLNLNQYTDSDQTDETYHVKANGAALFLSKSIWCNATDSQCIVECSALAACLSSTIYIGVHTGNTTTAPTMEPTREPSPAPTTVNRPRDSTTNSSTVMPTIEPTFLPIEPYDVIIYCNETASCFDANVASSKLQHHTNITVICNAENACNSMAIDVVD